MCEACARFARRSPELSGLVRVRDHAGEIVREDGMGVIYRLSSDPARLYGYNPTHVVVDELLEQIRKFSAENSFADDVCLVGIEYAGRPETESTDGGAAA